MKSIITIFIGSLLLIQSSFAYEPYRLPKGKRLVVSSETYQGFNLEEMKTLLKMDVDLKTLEEEKPKLQKIIKNNESIIIDLKTIGSITEKQVKIMEADRDKWFAKWSEENRRKHLAENKPNYGSWVAWTVAGIATAFSGVMLGVAVAK